MSQSSVQSNNMSNPVEPDCSTAIKRNADDIASDTESKRTKSNDREVNVDPIHDTAL